MFVLYAQSAEVVPVRAIDPVQTSVEAWAAAGVTFAAFAVQHDETPTRVGVVEAVGLWSG